MELVDVTDSKSVGLIPRVGSSPTTGTKRKGSPCGPLSFGISIIVWDENRRFDLAALSDLSLRAG